MAREELRHFFDGNPMVYGHASPEDLGQLSRIYELYPDVTRLLDDRDAVEVPHFECRRCGACCAAVKYVTVSHEDVKRWVIQKRPDILDALVIDRRRTPLLAIRKGDIQGAKSRARRLCGDAGIGSEYVFQLLFTTELLECAVYVRRTDGACVFLEKDGDVAACAIQDTKPHVCDKFPYYIGKYTDGRLLKEDSFCPSLSELEKKSRSP